MLGTGCLILDAGCWLLDAKSGKNKQQITNNKKISMTEIQNNKQCLVLEGFGHWILEFEIYL